MDKLDSHDDIQHFYANFDINDEIIEKLNLWKFYELMQEYIIGWVILEKNNNKLCFIHTL